MEGARLYVIGRRISRTMGLIVPWRQRTDAGLADGDFVIAATIADYLAGQ